MTELEQLSNELRTEIRASGAETRRHIDDVEERLGQRILTVETRLDGVETRLDRVETRLDSTDSAIERLRQQIETSTIETRRHFDVVAENLMGKIELVAEGVVAVDQKLDRFRDEVNEKFQQVDRRLLRLEGRGRGRAR